MPVLAATLADCLLIALLELSKWNTLPPRSAVYFCGATSVCLIAETGCAALPSAGVFASDYQQQ